MATMNAETRPSVGKANISAERRTPSSHSPKIIRFSDAVSIAVSSKTISRPHAARHSGVKVSPHDASTAKSRNTISGGKRISGFNATNNRKGLIKRETANVVQDQELKARLEVAKRARQEATLRGREAAAEWATRMAQKKTTVIGKEAT